MKGNEIRDRLDRSGRTQSALARHLGRDIHHVGRLIRSDKELLPSVADSIERFFNDDAAPEEPRTVRIPVFGYAAAGSDDRISLATDHVLEEMEIPSGMVRGDAMAVRVAGDSMEPRLFSGEVVILARMVAPARYGDCVVEMRDGTAMVKQYRGQRDGKVYLFQYNPEKEFWIDGSQVKSLHAVVFRR